MLVRILRIRMSSLAMAGRIGEAHRARDAVLRTDPALRLANIKSAPFRGLRRREIERSLANSWGTRMTACGHFSHIADLAGDGRF